MRRSHYYLGLILCFYAHLNASALASTQYVKDTVYVPMRSGPSNQHRIIHKGLKSGTALTLMNSEETDGWMFVRTSEDLEGWIPKQYLIDTPTAAITLANKLKELSALKAKSEKISTSAQSQKSTLNKTEKKLKQFERNNQKLNTELKKIKSISSGAIELDKKYQNLLEQHQLLQTANDALKAENTNLKNDQRFSQMFYGALLIIIGMLMAVIIPRLKVKKRSSEWAN